LDEKGYVRITDFGIAKFYQKENSSETSSTPGYMSPEVMCCQNHTIAVDYFALGVIAYYDGSCMYYLFSVLILEEVEKKLREDNG
jgi:serine/threonine protein kinase